MSKIPFQFCEWDKKVERLKAESKYYPYLHIRYESNEVYCSTLVRIERNGKWYTVHCVESGSYNGHGDDIDVCVQLMRSVHKIQHLYQICGMEDIDKLQISETERLKLNEPNLNT